MELIRISNRKLKIMLTPMDMCHFELDPDSFGEDSAQMHRAFRLLLSEIRQQTDFDADDSRISVQYFPSREGGCEMFICNLQQENGQTEENAVRPKLPLPITRQGLRPYKKRNGSFRKDCAYRFAKLEHLLSACKRLFEIDCILESSLYREENGDYVLFLTVYATSPYTTPEEIEFVNEYGTVEPASGLRLYILEHATKICADSAVEEMARLS